jgi:hypothetical protein
MSFNAQTFNTQTLVSDAYAEGKQVTKWSTTVTIGSVTLNANTIANVNSQTYAQSMNGELTDLTSLTIELVAFALASNKADTIKNQDGEVSVSLEIKADDVVAATLTGKGTINKHASNAQFVYFQPFAGSGKLGDKAVNVGGETA